MSDIDESLEQLLSKASPRPVPDSADAATAREAVRMEWLAVSGRNRSRKRMINFAVAATVLISAFSLFNVFRMPDVDIVRVASIQKSIGSIYLLGDQSELIRADDLATIHAGQIIVTGDDAGIALAWGNGGSVRLDSNTVVEFRNDSTVFLRSGQIYFDSMPAGLVTDLVVSDVGSFEIETDYGVVSHVGTQFMTQVESGELRVSVREGQVDVAGQYYPHLVSQGEQVLFSGQRRPAVFSINAYGDAWDWVGRTAPMVDVEGKSVHAFLSWVGRELGMTVEYEDDKVEQVAHQAILKDRIDTQQPAEALRLRMLTAALDWQFVEGVIYVSNSN